MEITKARRKKCENFHITLQATVIMIIMEALGKRIKYCGNISKEFFPTGRLLFCVHVVE
jgi:hypothetical protein